MVAVYIGARSFSAIAVTSTHRTTTARNSQMPRRVVWTKPGIEISRGAGGAPRNGGAASFTGVAASMAVALYVVRPSRPDDP